MNNPIFAKRHYEVIARILRGVIAGDNCDPVAALLIFDGFVKEFARDNPRFDIERFRKAINGK